MNSAELGLKLLLVLVQVDLLSTILKVSDAMKAGAASATYASTLSHFVTRGGERGQYEDLSMEAQR